MLTEHYDFKNKPADNDTTAWLITTTCYFSLWLFNLKFRGILNTLYKPQGIRSRERQYDNG